MYLWKFFDNTFDWEPDRWSCIYLSPFFRGTTTAPTTHIMLASLQGSNPKLMENGDMVLSVRLVQTHPLLTKLRTYRHFEYYRHFESTASTTDPNLATPTYKCLCRVCSFKSLKYHLFSWHKLKNDIPKIKWLSFQAKLQKHIHSESGSFFSHWKYVLFAYWKCSCFIVQAKNAVFYARLTSYTPLETCKQKYWSDMAVLGLILFQRAYTKHR